MAMGGGGYGPPGGHGPPGGDGGQQGWAQPGQQHQQLPSAQQGMQHQPQQHGMQHQPQGMQHQPQGMQHQPQGMQQGWGAPGPQGHGGGATALGVPLEPGERVLYFQRVSFSGHKTGMWIVGVILLPFFLLGLIFIFMALNVEKKQPNAYVVTDRRFIFIPGAGRPAEFIDFRQLSDVEPKRQDVSTGGGGLLGAVAGAVATHMLNKSADKNHKVHLPYWARTIGIIFTFQNGQKREVDAIHGGNAQRMGLTIGQVWAGLGSQMPPVQHEA